MYNWSYKDWAKIWTQMLISVVEEKFELRCWSQWWRKYLNSNIDLGGGGNTFADISLDPTELSHHSVEEQKVVGAHLQQL